MCVGGPFLLFFVRRTCPPGFNNCALLQHSKDYSKDRPGAEEMAKYRARALRQRQAAEKRAKSELNGSKEENKAIQEQLSKAQKEGQKATWNQDHPGH